MIDIASKKIAPTKIIAIDLVSLFVLVYLVFVSQQTIFLHRYDRAADRIGTDRRRFDKQIRYAW